MRKWPLGMCIWAQRGVWDRDGVHPPAILLLDASPDWRRGQVYVRFLETKLAGVCCSGGAHAEAIVLVQPPVFARPPRSEDGLTPITRHWKWFNADALGLLRGKIFNYPASGQDRQECDPEIFARIARMSARHDTLPRFLTVYILPERYFFIEKHMKNGSIRYKLCFRQAQSISSLNPTLPQDQRTFTSATGMNRAM